MAAPMGTLRYGTSSWAEKSWVGPFYPRGTPPGNFLTHYAGHGPATIRQLADQIPEELRG